MGERGLGSLATPIAEWTQLLGHQLLTQEERSQADIEVLGIDDASRRKAPWVVVSPRRLRADTQAQLRAQGARGVLDGDHGLLDLAFLYAECLFSSRAEQRRHGLNHGRLEVHVLDPGANLRRDSQGRLVGLNRCGVWVDAPELSFPGGASVDLAVPLGRRTVRLSGRVIVDQWEPEPQLMGIELALERCMGCSSFRGLARYLRAHGHPVSSPA